MAAGNGAATYDGTTWTPVPIQPKGFINLSCPSDGHCQAADSFGRSLTYTNGAWSKPRPIAGSPYLYRLSCSSMSFCVAVNSAEGGAWQLTGTTWRHITAPEPRHLWDVSCIPGAHCVVSTDLGQAFDVDRTDWSAAITVVPAESAPDAVSCFGPGDCMAVDTEGHAYQQSAGTWNATYRVAPLTTSLTSVSCPTDTFCLAAGHHDGGAQNGVAATWNGTSWSPTRVVDPAGIVDVSCPTATHCVAIDAADNVISYDNGSWSGRVHLEQKKGFDVLVSVSCPTTAFCVAVDNAGHTFRLGPAGWVSAGNVHAALFSVSCPSADLCETIDGVRQYRYNGTTWTIEGDFPPDGNAGFPYTTRLSCVGADFCLTIATYDDPALAPSDTFERTSDGWSEAVPSFSAGTGFPTPVSCIAGHPITCTATGSKGFARTGVFTGS
jgi:hypothetical protein